jgi:hypothetical protein
VENIGTTATYHHLQPSPTEHRENNRRKMLKKTESTDNVEEDGKHRKRERNSGNPIWIKTAGVEMESTETDGTW